jgi:hypothetical protein
MLHRALPLTLGLTVLAGPVAGPAQAAAIGRFGGPWVGGKLREGDFDQLQREWADERFERPLRLRIGVDSGDGLQVARLGRWLQDRRPVIKLERDCVHVCARDLLPAGRALLADRGVLIAFSSMDAWPLVLKRAVDTGQLFVDDGGAGQAMRDRFIAGMRVYWEQAAAIQSLRAEGAGPPAPALAFLDRLTRPGGVVGTTFGTLDFKFEMKHSELGCMAWVPDAQGLRQLGLDLPGYTRPSLAEAAKRLNLPPGRIYTGPLPATPPDQLLCTGNDAPATR